MKFEIKIIIYKKSGNGMYDDKRSVSYLKTRHFYTTLLWLDCGGEEAIQGKQLCVPSMPGCYHEAREGEGLTCKQGNLDNSYNTTTLKSSISILHFFVRM